MPHDTPLITTIVAALVLAYVFGAIAHRLKLPPLVGYLIAGVAVGPHSPGFVADQTLASQLAEIGVILLMFGVGLHFSLRDLLSVRAVAIPGALLQIAVATALGVGVASLLGWSLVGGLVFGLALSVASTVVLLKALQDRHLIDSDRGRIAVGWLIVEDLAMVLALVLIPALAGVMGGPAAAGVDAAAHAGNDPFLALTEQVLHMHLPVAGVLAVTLVKLLAFVGFMVVVGRRIIPFVLHATAHTGSRELFRLAVLAIALGVAAGAAYLFGVSLALGAFFAGMILSESELSHRAAQETLPLRDAFGVLFFVSVGMLFDPSIILRDPLPLVATLAIILVGKSLAGFLLLVLFRQPVAAGLTISASLAQIGEFSFILAAMGVSLGVLPEEGRGLILAGAIISIVLNPLAFWVAERLRPRLERRAARHTEPELGPVVPDRPDQAPQADESPEGVLEEVAQPTRLSNHVVLIGYGRVGGVVADELDREGVPFLLIEDAEGRVLAARAKGIEVVVGNAATHETLTLANVMGARCVVIAIPNAFEAGQATEQCRKLNAAIRIIARAHSEDEVEYLRRLGADEVIMGEREIGLGMVDWMRGGEPREDVTPGPRFSAGENLLRQARQSAGPLSAAVPGAEPVDEGAPETPASGSVAPPVAMPPRPIEPVSLGAAPSAPAAPEVGVLAGLAAAAGAVSGAAASAVETDEPVPGSEGTPAVEAVPDTAPPLASATPELAGDDLPADPAVPAEPANPTIEARPGDEAVSRVPEASAPLAETEPATVPTPAAATAEPDDVPGATPEAPADPALSTNEPNAGAVTDVAAAEAGAAQQANDPGTPPEAPDPEPVISPSASPGFRVVSPADIIILPPEPARKGGPRGQGEDDDDAPPPFRSQFWDEPAPEGAPDFERGTNMPPLRDVHQAEAARAAVEAGAWMEALERDLFGGDPARPAPTPTPPEEPGPAPQPIETPQPPEDPPPAPQPIETPRPVEEPAPTPQPIETPTPTEMPTPSRVPPVTPEPRGRREETAGAVGPGGVKREPHL